MSMDYSPIISVAFKFWWVIPAIFVVALFKSPWAKGYFGELAVRISAKLRLDGDIYRAIHNVTLPTPDGTTQIDHIFVSRFGIFVVETKNMRGWIFGGEKQSQWTQKIYKNSYKFQNPIRQNYKHVKSLESALNVESENIHSIIAFVGDCTLKTPMPPNVCRGGKFLSYIKSHTDQVFSPEEVERLVAQIESGRLTPSFATHRQHVAGLKARNDPNASINCPKCGSPMELRTAKKGERAGEQFWGCSAYPKCRTILDKSASTG